MNKFYIAFRKCAWVIAGGAAVACFAAFIWHGSTILSHPISDPASQRIVPYTVHGTTYYITKAEEKIHSRLLWAWITSLVAVAICKIVDEIWPTSPNDDSNIEP